MSENRASFAGDLSLAAFRQLLKLPPHEIEIGEIRRFVAAIVELWNAEEKVVRYTAIDVLRHLRRLQQTPTADTLLEIACS